MVLCVLTVVHLCRVLLWYGVITPLLYPPSSIMLSFPFLSSCLPLMLLLLIFSYLPFSSLPCHIPIPSFPSARHQEESDHCRHESTCQSPHSNPHRGRVTGHWWGHIRGFRTHYGQGSGDGVSWVHDPLRAVLNFGFLVFFQNPPRIPSSTSSIKC